MNLVEVRDLRLTARSTGKVLVDGVNLVLEKGKTTVFIGESGGGKTLNARALAGFLPRSVVKTVSATHDVARKKSFVFQEAAASLNPYLKIGYQLLEGTEKSKDEALELLLKLDIDQPALRFQQFPHELSIGMSQRVALAIALLQKPDLLILDEPTSAVDVETREKILGILRTEKAERGLTLLLISHDFKLVQEMADYIYVFRSGKIEEEGAASLRAPQSLYLRRLLQALPRWKESRRRLSEDAL